MPARTTPSPQTDQDAERVPERLPGHAAMTRARMRACGRSRFGRARLDARWRPHVLPSPDRRQDLR